MHDVAQPDQLDKLNQAPRPRRGTGANIRTGTRRPAAVPTHRWRRDRSAPAMKHRRPRCDRRAPPPSRSTEPHRLANPGARRSTSTLFSACRPAESCGTNSLQSRNSSRGLGAPFIGHEAIAVARTKGCTAPVPSGSGPGGRALPTGRTRAEVAWPPPTAPRPYGARVIRRPRVRSRTRRSRRWRRVRHRDYAPTGCDAWVTGAARSNLAVNGALPRPGPFVAVISVGARRPAWRGARAVKHPQPLCCGRAGARGD